MVLLGTSSFSTQKYFRLFPFFLLCFLLVGSNGTRWWHFFLPPGSLQVEIDLGYDVGAEFGDAMEYTRQSAMDGYVFLDWFAIPQITARAEGVNEENTRSDAALAVQSIPFYVEADFLSGGVEK